MIAESNGANVVSEQKREGQFTGWHMLGIMVLFFGTIITVNLIMATSAIRSWTGLEVQNSYVASQEFNERLAAADAQAALNLNIDLHYDGANLIFSLQSEQGEVLDASNVVIALTRPIGTTEDRTLTLTRQGDVFVVADDLPAGVWNVEINADVAGQAPFYHRARLTVGS